MMMRPVCFVVFAARFFLESTDSLPEEHWATSYYVSYCATIKHDESKHQRATAAAIWWLDALGYIVGSFQCINDVLHVVRNILQ